MTVSPAMWVTGNMASNMSLKETKTEADTSENTTTIQRVYSLQTAACFISFFFCFKGEKNCRHNRRLVKLLNSLSSGLDLCQNPGFNTCPDQPAQEVFQTHQTSESMIIKKCALQNLQPVSLHLHRNRSTQRIRHDDSLYLVSVFQESGAEKTNTTKADLST